MKILILCHEALVPEPNFLRKSSRFIEYQPWRTEGYVARCLLKQGHSVTFCGVDRTLAPLREALDVDRPDVVFNLLEEFDGEGLLEPLIVNFLSAKKYAVTGCNGYGLLLAKNKVGTKSLLEEAGVAVPGNKSWPKIVKYVNEESSRGITARSIVASQKDLNRIRIRLKKKVNSPIFSEEYIEGRELFCSVLKLKKKR